MQMDFQMDYRRGCLIRGERSRETSYTKDYEQLYELLNMKKKMDM